MDEQTFIKKYGTEWKKMFELCVWNVPFMRDWLREKWNEVYESVADYGISNTPDLWLMLAHHLAMLHMDEILNKSE